MTKFQELVELHKKISDENFYNEVFKDIYEIMNNHFNYKLPPLTSITLNILSEEKWFKLTKLIVKLNIEDTGSMTRHHKLLSDGRMILSTGNYVLSINIDSISKHALKSHDNHSNFIWNYVIVIAHELLHLVDGSAGDTIEGELRLHRKEIEVAEKFLDYTLTKEQKIQRENEICKILKRKLKDPK